jgi:hypothetical protein
MSNTKKPIDENCSLSIADFCRLVGISSFTYYALRKRGLTPKEFRIPGTQIVRISPQARREWQERFESSAMQEWAEREFERRSAINVKAGKLAAESPLHPRYRPPAPKKRGRPRKPLQAAE